MFKHKMRTILAVFVLCALYSVSANPVRDDSCSGVPITLPEVKLLNITRFVIGRPGQVHLRLKSSYPLAFLWFKNILKEQQSYPAIIIDDDHFSTSWSRPTSGEYDTVLTVKAVTADDTKFNRFTLEMTIHHPCASIKMMMLLGSDNILKQNLESPVRIDAISKQMVKKNIGDSLRLQLKATFTAKSNERLFGSPISVSKWYSTVSRNGIYDRLNLYVHENGKELPLNAKNVINDVKKINEGTFEAHSKMVLNPLLQSDQGFFQCRLTYDLARDVFIHLYAMTEFRYSDRLMPAVAVRPCSGLPNKKEDLETEHGVVQVPIRAGMENCIECFAHAVPDFMMVFAKINPDFRSGIQFMQPIAKFDYGSLKRYVYPLAAVEDEIRHYVCSAGRKDGVTAVPMRVVPYTPVKLTEVSPNELNLVDTNKVIFTCRATGTPSPSITFYKSPKNSILPDGASPEDRGWAKVAAGGTIEVMTSHDLETKVTTGIMAVEDVSDDTDRGRFDYTCVAKNDYSMKAGTVFVDSFSRQLSPPDSD
ncbi:uncharacterized protein LOC135484500 [Lineus longissimus]|uniref:uncharacterized protein LOC135484500 n=1 Tax=Lineus longissimus TaxID=88925 RepID=UPI002B4EDA9F